jgi:hypothetical protein
VARPVPGSATQGVADIDVCDAPQRVQVLMRQARWFDFLSGIRTLRLGD